MFTTAKCRSCGASIIWAETAAGKRMPVDVEPSPAGNVALEPRPGLDPLATVNEPLFASSLRKSHFATCPNAASHRKAKTKS